MEWYKKVKPVTDRNPSQPSDSLGNGEAVAILSTVILLVIIVRLRLLGMPLERDEGEFAYVAQLMLQGISPYKLAYVIKLPGTAAVYALSMAVFGQTAQGIHTGLLFANVTAVILVFLLARRWFGICAGLVAGASYALMSLNWDVCGNAAHATQFIVPAAIGGILLLLRGLESGRAAALFWSGVLFGVAFLFKQPGVLFGAYGGILLVASESGDRPVNWTRCLKRVGVFGIGIILPFAVLCLILWRAGVFEKFWHWSFAVAGQRWSSWQSAREMLGWFFDAEKTSRELLFWCAAGLALPFVFWMNTARSARLAFLGFCAVSFAAVSVGFVFQAHYFILALPAIGILIGLVVAEALRKLQDSKALARWAGLPLLLFFLTWARIVYGDWLYLFQATPEQAVLITYGSCPFCEAVRVADYIERHSAPDSQIAVLGSEPEIYFYTHRRAASGHLSTYLLVDASAAAREMREEMALEIEQAAPEYIVLVKNTDSWGTDLGSVSSLAQTMLPYIKDSYKVAGVVDGVAPDPVVYRWDGEAARYTPRSQSCIIVYRKVSTIEPRPHFAW